MKNEVLDSTLQIRINKETKAKLKYVSEVRGYKNLSSYIKDLVNRDTSEHEYSRENSERMFLK